ncbi:MAG: 4'-phosphopantetheinyl transferase family protein [Burkholderiales bacterium]
MEVGIDLEFARSDFDGLDIAKRYFFGSELADIRSGPPDERRKAFFRYWVAKEAVLKGQGVGLGFPLDQFLVSFTDAQQQEATVRSMDARRLGEDWFVRMLPSDPAWPAAVTARGTAWSVQLRHPEG